MNKELKQAVELPYTIGFCILNDTVLMLHRKFPPNQHLWNGIGGKIAPGETPDDAIAREIMEEAHLDVNLAQSVNYVGIVTWTVVRDETNHHKGMYAYTIRFKDGIEWKNKVTDEGLLEWKALDWVIDKENRQVVDNIPHFLPPMLEASEPVRYHCQYTDGNLDQVFIYPL
ncbi:MAG: NUDIX domain-containing protein [Anaerolineae bacterium]|nr:NUDIX domain-containing protein [Anaerolineae bacterium]